MVQLSRAKHTDLEYLVGKDLEGVYSKLSRILTTDELSYFARPFVSSIETAWKAQEGNYLSYILLSEEEKQKTNNFIQEIESRIRPKLEGNSGLRKIADSILSIPSDEQIMVSFDSAKVQVVLVQWGCKDIRVQGVINPLDRIRKIPKSDHTNVSIFVKYSDGNQASNIVLKFLYKDNVEEIQTNENGVKDLGPLKNGSIFNIQSKDSDNQKAIQVVEDKEEYNVTIPIYSCVEIEVVNQVGENIGMEDLKIEYLGNSTIYKSDKNGLVYIDNVKITESSYLVSSVSDPDIKRSYRLSSDGNKFVFELKKKRVSDGILKVVDQQGDPVAQHELVSVVNENEYHIKSNNDGEVILQRLEIDSEFQVKDPSDKYNTQLFKLTDETKEFEYVVSPLVVRDIVIRLVGDKGHSLPQVPLDIKTKRKEFNRLTDNEGKVIFKQGIFEDSERVNVDIHLKDKNNSPIVKRKSFKYNEYDFEYILKLKKFNKLWLLLLLLPLFFLLMIEQDKDIRLKTINMENNEAISNVEVSLEYKKAFIYNDGEFFGSITMKRNGVTDSIGMIVFDSLQYTIYSTIFKRFTPAVIEANSKCYEQHNILQKIFHSIGTNRVVKIPMSPILFKGHIRVIDELTGEPIPNVFLEMNYLSQDEKGLVKESARTNTLGRGIFNYLPKCGYVNKIFASKYGYYPDSLTNKQVVDLALIKDEKYRTIKLKPIKESIEFFIINCNNGEPLVGKADIYLNGRKVNMNPILTNINGTGRCVYKDVPIIKDLQIEARHKYFESSKLTQIYTVEEFINLPDSLRTICLTPKDAHIDFINLDSLTNKPIVGVKNLVTIRNNLGIRRDTISSTTNGVFSVAGISVGDKITISSFKEPYYEDKIETILNRPFEELIIANSSSREIKLSPKSFDIEFYTKDIEEDTLVNNVNLEVSINGKVIDKPNSSGKGVFLVSTFYSDEITIIARKNGYKTNYEKIRKTPVKQVLNSPANKRTIPMELPSCNTTTEGNIPGKTYYVHSYKMGKSSGEFIFKYFTHLAADKLNIYCGKNTDEENLIDSIYEATGFEFSKDEKWIEKKYKYFNCKVITVEVIGRTNWKYTINCPN